MRKPEVQMAGHETPEGSKLLGDGTEIPLGGEGVLDSVADHTSDVFRTAKTDQQPLLDD